MAAFIAEPVMGAGGVIVPPETYFEKIMAVCAKHDLFVISDEVICGFGRLGTAFGCEKLGFKPHAISVAKALSSAYLPIAARDDPGDHVRGAARREQKDRRRSATASPMAVIRFRLRSRSRRSKSTRATASSRRPPSTRRCSRRGSQALGEHPLVGEARGLGLIGGVELVADKASKRSFDRQHGVGARAVRFAEEEGLIVRSVLRRRADAVAAAGHQRAEIDELFDRLDAGARQDARLGHARAAWRKADAHDARM